MKIPKSFLPEKNLEEKTNQLIESYDTLYNKELIENLTHGLWEFQKRVERLSTIYELYAIAEDIVKKFDVQKSPVINYLLQDEDFRHCAIEESYSGYYVSAMINNWVPKNTIFTINVEGLLLHSLGTYLNKITLIVDGDVGWQTGMLMQSGKLIVNGNCDAVGRLMCGGEIRIYGNIKEKQIGGESKSGKIYQFNKLIWSKE